MRKIILLLLGSIFVFNAIAQNYNSKIPFEDTYTKQWENIVTLLGEHKTADAVIAIDSVYYYAKLRNESLMMFKAQLYFLQVVNDTSDNIIEDLIAAAEQHIKEAKFPYSAIWQSITAQLYWEYYQANRLKILERPMVSMEILIEDIDKWDANRFFDKTASLYLKSISHIDELQYINIHDLEPVLFRGDSVENLRPNLFDMLAFRALDFFENGEKDITKPENTFEMDDPNAFAPAGAFVNQKFMTKDLTSYTWLSLQWYKQILLMHENDSLKDAYIDADLRRLDYVYKTSVLSNKEQLYSQALQFIETSFPDNPIAAMATYKLAALMAGMEKIDTILTPEEQNINNLFIINNGKSKIDYQPIVTKLKSVIIKFPNSVAASMSAGLLSIMENKTLAFENEKVVLSGEAFKFLLRYRNTNKAWVRIVPVTNTEYRKRSNTDYTTWSRSLLKRPQISNFQVSLPASEDYYEHSTEIRVGALPTGTYSLFVSLKGNFSNDSNIIQSKIFQVSSLSYVSQTGNDPDLKEYILNRRTGEPVNHATVIRYKGIDPKSWHEKSKTHKDGSFVFKHIKQDYFNGFINIIYDKDTLWTDYNKAYPAQEDESIVRTFFYPDRIVYHPGQTIQFKGIIVRKWNNGNNTEVLKNKNTEVFFMDPTGTMLKTLKLVSNDFGSFSGRFIVPIGVSGTMKIGSESGEIGIPVEEYKPGSSYIQFDPVKSAYSIDENIKIKGSLKTNNGKNIEGTVIKYKVVRSIIKTDAIKNCYGLDINPPDSEICNGIVQTDKEGRFPIYFKALPSHFAERKCAPIFSYTIYTEAVTAFNDTITASQQVRAGFASIQLDSYLPDIGRPDELDTLIIKSENLDGKFIVANIHLQISRLHTPGSLYRKRLWDMPDVYIIDSDDYRKQFPFDEYRNESNPDTWQKEEQVFDSIILPNENGIINVPIKTWNKNGWYLVEIKTADKKGNEVYKRKLVEVWDKNNPGNIPDPIQIEETNSFIEPGVFPHLTILSGFDSCLILFREENLGKHATYERVHYSGKPIVLNRQISDNDRGSIRISFMLMKNNRLYSKDITIPILKANKELGLKLDTIQKKNKVSVNENLKINVTGSRNEKLDAEMLVSIYDASDEIGSFNHWTFNDFFPVTYSTGYWLSDIKSEKSYNLFLNHAGPESFPSHPIYSKFIVIGDDFKNMNSEIKSEKDKFKGGINEGWGNKPGAITGKRNKRHKRKNIAMNSINVDNEIANTNGDVIKELKEKADSVAELDLFPKLSIKPEVQTITSHKNNLPDKQIPEFEYIKNHNETTFFYPQLRTDTSENIQFDLHLPKTTSTYWKFKAIAYTKDLATGLLEGKIQSTRRIRIVPDLPQFLQGGDTLVMSAKVINNSDSAVTGFAALHFFRASNSECLDSIFNLQKSGVSFSVKKGQGEVMYWTARIPELLNEPARLVFSVQSGNYTDTEENTLPLLSHKKRITRSVPFYINGNDSLKFSVDKLLNLDTSKILSRKMAELSIEFTANTEWYAVQALARLLKCTPEDNMQIFNYYFESVLADHVIHNFANVGELLKEWKVDYKDTVLLHFKNNANTEADLFRQYKYCEKDEKYMIAQLFDANRLEQAQRTSIKKLEELQFASGGFSWYKGMEANRYITQNILIGIGKLRHLTGRSTKALDSITKNALYLLDKIVKKEYDILLSNKASDMSLAQMSNEDVQYLYMRSFFKDHPVSKSNSLAFNYMKQQAITYSNRFNPYLQGMLAMAFFIEGDTVNSVNILHSLKTLAHTNEKKELFFPKTGESFWYNASIEQQCLLIECYNEILHDTFLVNNMKLWLIDNMNTECNLTDNGMADACYALLYKGFEQQSEKPAINIQLGKKLYNNNEDMNTQQVSTYSIVNFDQDSVSGDKGDFKISVKDNSGGIIWGVLNQQYFEEENNNPHFDKPITMNKLLFTVINSGKGIEFQPVNEQNNPKIGDRVLVRLEINVEKEMDYIEITDMLPACFDTKTLFDGFRSQNGVGYYESIKDASVSFYINHLNKGIYTFEYTVFTTHAGEFSGGMAKIQSMAVPGIICKNESIRIHVNATGVK